MLNQAWKCADLGEIKYSIFRMVKYLGGEVNSFLTGKNVSICMEAMATSLSLGTHVSLSVMDDVTEATSRFSFTLDSVDALLPTDRRRWV